MHSTRNFQAMIGFEPNFRVDIMSSTLHSREITIQFRTLQWSKMEKKHRHNSHLIIHFPTSEGVSKVSERANEWAQRRARAKRAVRSKQTSERCERMSKRTSEWPSTYVSILVCSRPHCKVQRMTNWPLTRGLKRAKRARTRQKMHSVMFKMFLLILTQFSTAFLKC